MPKKLTQEEFISRYKNKNQQLDYSKTIYKGSKEKVVITCPKHGDFTIIAGDFLRSGKCPKCSYNIPTNSEFIDRCKQHYPNYDYSNTLYITRDKPVEVRCPIHNHIWTPLAFNLENGSAMCSKCKSDLYKKLFTKSQEEFINKCRDIHNNEYDYSKVKYTGADNKITIICPKHGEFQQIAGNHIRGTGCPKCHRSLGENKIINYLEKYQIPFKDQYKIIYLNNKKFFIDFYLPNYNTFIEYNGEQHYIPVERFGGQVKFEQQQKRDEYVRQYCKENNINLLEIKYDENVEEVLNQYFERFKNVK